MGQNIWITKTRKTGTWTIDINVYNANMAAILFTVYEFSTFTAIFQIIIHCIYIYLLYIYTLDLREYYYLYILGFKCSFKDFSFK